MDDKALQKALANPEQALLEIDKVESERRLIDFIKNGWHQLEPGSPFVPGWAVEATCDHLQAVTEGEIKRLLINVPPGCTKPLQVDTPTLTTHGWKKHGDLRVGDYVYGPDGKPKKVQGTTPHSLQESYEVVMNDGSRIIAGHAHEWEIERSLNGSGNRETITVETKELRTGLRPDSIRIHEPVDTPPSELLIDPYIMGVWLGDGTSREGVISCMASDSHVLIERYGARISFTKLASDEGNTHTQDFHALNIPGLRTKLRIKNLLQNKHIPEEYLTASIEQRLELLRGLLDSDGHCDKKGLAGFVNTNKTLSDGFRELVFSLGMQPHTNVRRGKIGDKEHKMAYRTYFRCRKNLRIFNLDRKQERCVPPTTRAKRRYIKEVNRLPDQVVSCIQVEKRVYLAGRSYLRTRNSMTTSVFWPAWEWGPRNMPSYRYILAAHEKDLATRDNVRCRDLLRDQWYQGHWGDRVKIKSDDSGKEKYENESTGWRRASSVGSGLTGWRGDRLILDDPHSIKKADSDAFREDVLRWFSETLPTRLNKPAESAIVVIMQRVHERDVSGLILAEELGYEHLMLPMEFEAERRSYSVVKPSYIEDPQLVKVVWNSEEKAWRPWKESDVDDEGNALPSKMKFASDARRVDGELLWPERFTRESVDELKKALRSWGGSYAEAGQLQQRPAPRGGGMFQKEDWQYVDRVPADAVRRVRGWDLAATKKKEKKTAAYTASVRMSMCDGKIYIEDVERAQKGPSDVEKMIKSNAARDGWSVMQDFPQDPGQAGKVQKVAIGKLLHGYSFTFSPESGSKENRADPLAAQVEINNVYLVRGHWNAAFINEASLFPNGTFKDQIDAATRAYGCLISKRRRLVGAAPVVVQLVSGG
jgi:predicted phage terminase large subunit-like protein